MTAPAAAGRLPELDRLTADLDRRVAAWCRQAGRVLDVWVEPVAGVPGQWRVCRRGRVRGSTSRQTRTFPSAAAAWASLRAQAPGGAVPPQVTAGTVEGVPPCLLHHHDVPPPGRGAVRGASGRGQGVALAGGWGQPLGTGLAAPTHLDMVRAGRAAAGPQTEPNH